MTTDKATTLETLQNDADALAVLVRLAEYGAGACMKDGRYRRDVAALYGDGAGGYDADAVLAWARQRLAETENTIEALDGTGMPSPPAARVAVLIEGGIVETIYTDTPGVEVVVLDSDLDGLDDDQERRIVQTDDGCRYYPHRGVEVYNLAARAVEAFDLVRAVEASE